MHENTLVGSWNGFIRFGENPIHIVLHLDLGPDGWNGTSDFPQLQRLGLPLRELQFADGELRFATRSFGDFKGRLATDGVAIEGAFTQGEKTHTLTLTRGSGACLAPPRPQAPTAPFPYETQEVRIAPPAAAFPLAGTLSLPRSRAPQAAVLLIPGSGAMDRNQSLFGHQPFLVLADHLTRHGYAVLRLDKRGVGGSGGDRATVTLADETADGMAALDWLRAQPALAGVPLGVIGHSMGAATAFDLGAQRVDLGFVVAMAGAVSTLGEAFAERECVALSRKGVDAEAVDRHGRFTRALYEDLRERALDDPIDAAQVRALAVSHGAVATAVVPDSAEWIARLNEPWFRSAVRLEPAPLLSQVRAPFMAMSGALDTQVVAESSLAAMRELLAGQGHPDVETHLLPGLNHLFQTCTDGAVFRYALIEETFAPVALDTLTGWLDARFAT